MNITSVTTMISSIPVYSAIRAAGWDMKILSGFKKEDLVAYVNLGAYSGLVFTEETYNMFVPAKRELARRNGISDNTVGGFILTIRNAEMWDTVAYSDDVLAQVLVAVSANELHLPDNEQKEVAEAAIAELGDRFEETGGMGWFDADLRGSNWRHELHKLLNKLIEYRIHESARIEAERWSTFLEFNRIMNTEFGTNF